MSVISSNSNASPSALQQALAKLAADQAAKAAADVIKADQAAVDTAQLESATDVPTQTTTSNVVDLTA
ncbi:MAG: hypothetical protein NTAFB05_13130 [Nitrobacter sp.]